MQKDSPGVVFGVEGFGRDIQEVLIQLSDNSFRLVVPIGDLNMGELVALTELHALDNLIFCAIGLQKHRKVENKD